MSIDEIRDRLEACPEWAVMSCYDVALYANSYKPDVTTLLKEAACPCCKNGVNLEGAVCGECKGTGLAILAYEHVRVLWKQQRDEIAELKAEITRLKGLKGDIADPRIQIQCVSCGDPAIVPAKMVPVDDSGVCLECQEEIKNEMQ